MRRQNLDCTAGSRGLQIRAHPERQQRIVDATSARYGKAFGSSGRPGGRRSRRGDSERDALAA